MFFGNFHVLANKKTFLIIYYYPISKLMVYIFRNFMSQMPTVNLHQYTNIQINPLLLLSIAILFIAATPDCQCLFLNRIFFRTKIGLLFAEMITFYFPPKIHSSSILSATKIIIKCTCFICFAIKKLWDKDKAQHPPRFLDNKIRMKLYF